MRRTVYTFILALIIVPIVLLTSSCKEDDGSPVGATHPFAGSWSVEDSASSPSQKGQMIINADGDFNFSMLLYRDSLVNRNTHSLIGNVNTGGQLTGRILDSTRVQKGTIGGTLQAKVGTWANLTASIPYYRIWSKKD